MGIKHSVSGRAIVAFSLILIAWWPVASEAQSDSLLRAYNQFLSLYKQGRLTEAEPLAREALKLSEMEYGAAHEVTAILLGYLAEVYDRSGRDAEAEPLYVRSLKIKERVLGPSHLEIAVTLHNLATLYKTQGRYAEAEPLFKRSLVISERTLGPDHPAVASVLNNLAQLYGAQGRYTEAEPLFKRALAISEETLGSSHPHVAASLNSLAGFYESQGRYTESEPLLQRALAIREKDLGPSHPDVAASLNSLAGLYESQGRYAEAEPLYRRSLDIMEEILGPSHPRVADIFNNLAALFQSQGRYADAEPFHKRSLAIREKALEPNHPDVAQSLNNLATVYKAQGRYAEAEPLIKRSLSIAEKALGPSHPNVANILNNLAELYRAKERYVEVEPLIMRALAIREATLGPGHLNVATSLNNLAGLYVSQGRHAEAEPLYERSLEITETILGSYHPRVARIHSNLSELSVALGDFRAAYIDISMASNILGFRAAQIGGSGQRARLDEQKRYRDIFAAHALLALYNAERMPSKRSLFVADGFEAGQLAKATSTAAAVARMGARFAANDDALARIVRARQDASERRQHLEKMLINAVGLPPDKSNSKTERKLRDQLIQLEFRINELDKRISDEFPEYAELVSPPPTPLDEIQHLLGPREALLAYMTFNTGTTLWVVRRDDAEMFLLDMGESALEGAVKRLRAGLDPAGITSLSNLPAFDTMKAFRLYQQIFSAAEPMLQGISHLLVVPDGALQSLPLGVLVTKETKADFTLVQNSFFLRSPSV